jgi:hypothetical protein
MQDKKKYFLVYFSLVFLKNFIGNFYLSTGFLVAKIWDLAAWFLGGALGWNLLFIDQLLWVYFSHPEAELSKEVKTLVDQGRYKAVYRFLKEKEDKQQHRAFKNFLFQISWLVLTIFVMTSTAGLFGKGLVMGVGLHLLIEEWQSFQSQGNFDWLFWQMKEKLDQHGQKIFLYLVSGFFILFSLTV